MITKPVYTTILQVGRKSENLYVVNQYDESGTCGNHYYTNFYTPDSLDYFIDTLREDGQEVEVS